MTRCSKDAVEASTSDSSLSLTIWIDTRSGHNYDMQRLAPCLRALEADMLLDDISRACLLMPVRHLNQDTSYQSTSHETLASMPSWKGRGLNHLIFDYTDQPRTEFPTDDAILVKTAMRIDEYRPGFDVPFPLLPNGVATHATLGELHRAETAERKLLLSFKGDCSHNGNGRWEDTRRAMARLHNGIDVIVLCTSKQSSAAAKYDYKELMLTSKFALAPAGNGLHSFRLAESIFLGAIPVIIDDQLVLPFCSVIDWSRFSVRVRSFDVHRLPQILRTINPAQLEMMQARLRQVNERYFVYPFNTALSLVKLRVREEQERQMEMRSRNIYESLGYSINASRD